MSHEDDENEGAKVVPFPLPQAPESEGQGPKCTCRADGKPCSACDT